MMISLSIICDLPNFVPYKIYSKNKLSVLGNFSYTPYMEVMNLSKNNGACTVLPDSLNSIVLPTEL